MSAVSFFKFIIKEAFSLRGPFYNVTLMLLIATMFIGLAAYYQQFWWGLGLTGMRNYVAWGVYIASFVFLVGVAMAAGVVATAAYIFNDKDLKPLSIPAEILAISALIMDFLFILVDLGRPDRILNIFPIIGTPNFPSSILVWDFIVLTTYLCFCIALALIPGYMMYKGKEPKGRLLTAICAISLPFAVSIHTVTAFIFAALVARPYWNTAILAPRFLASAIVSGPAILILTALILRWLRMYEVPEGAIRKLALMVLLAMVINIFFFGCEIFASLYAGAPEHVEPMIYALFGLGVPTYMAVASWTALVVDILAVALLVTPDTRRSPAGLSVAMILALIGMWLEKGIGTVIPGFVPTPVGEVWQYFPTLTEALVSTMVFAVGIAIYVVFVNVFVRLAKLHEGHA